MNTVTKPSICLHRVFQKQKCFKKKIFTPSLYSINLKMDKNQILLLITRITWFLKRMLRKIFNYVGKSISEIQSLGDFDSKGDQKKMTWYATLISIDLVLIFKIETFWEKSFFENYWDIFFHFPFLSLSFLYTRNVKWHCHLKTTGSIRVIKMNVFTLFQNLGGKTLAGIMDASYRFLQMIFFKSMKLPLFLFLWMFLLWMGIEFCQIPESVVWSEDFFPLVS